MITIDDLVKDYEKFKLYAENLETRGDYEGLIRLAHAFAIYLALYAVGCSKPAVIARRQALHEVFHDPFSSLYEVHFTDQ